MIVNNKFKFVFIHNPRTAGMSLRTAIKEYDDYDGKFSGFEKQDDCIISLMHMPMIHLEKHYPWVIEKMQQYFTFMIIRNPYIRFISAFNRTHDSVYEDYMNNQNNEVYRSKIDRFLETLDEKQIMEHNYAYRHFILQTDMAFLRGTTFVDTFFKYESIPQCFESLSYYNFYLFCAVKKMKYLNQRRLACHYNDVLTPAAKQKIEFIYNRDFQTFKYDIDEK